VALSDRELLDVRFSQLGISIHGTELELRLEDLNNELAKRGVPLDVHAWLSDEWFSPDTTPGIAFPFYLAHPRLQRLERKMVLEVEGAGKRECMRILRHEAGHVVQHAWQLHRRRKWQETFGKSSTPYPQSYRPNPASRDYVQHLRRWYAQCHPDEDFAETFAVWLTPRSNWRTKYADWPALKKLQYVDELMKEIAEEKPAITNRVEVDPIRRMTMTLGEHYDRKLEHYAVDQPASFDADLERIFSVEPRSSGSPSATGFIRRNRAAIRRLAARRTGEYQLTLDAALDDMIDRCRALKLRAPGSERRLRSELTELLTSRSVRSLYSSSRRQWFAV
jgi:hypothetical protein